MADKINLTERLMFLDSALLVADGGKEAEELLGIEAGLKSLSKLVKASRTAKIDWDEALRVGNQWYDRINKASRKQDRQQRSQALEQFEAEARQAGLKPVQYAVRWLLDQPGIVSVVMGVKRFEQLSDVIDACS